MGSLLNRAFGVFDRAVGIEARAALDARRVELRKRFERDDLGGIFDALSEFGGQALRWSWVLRAIDEWYAMVSDVRVSTADRKSGAAHLRRVGAALASAIGKGRVETEKTRRDRQFVRTHLPVVQAYRRALRRDARAKPPESLILAGFTPEALRDRRTGVGPYDIVGERLNLSVERIKQLARPV
jgi:hypothetical protein